MRDRFERARSRLEAAIRRRREGRVRTEAAGPVAESRDPSAAGAGPDGERPGAAAGERPGAAAGERPGGGGPGPTGKAAGGIGAGARTLVERGRLLAAEGADRVVDGWLELSPSTRRRLIAVSSVALAVLVLIVVAALTICWFPGGARCAPDDDAIALVPADAAAYVHLNLDPGTEQGELAAELSRRLPQLAEGGAALLGDLASRKIDYQREVAPWSGGEAALALVGEGLGLERLLILEADSGEEALAFARTLQRGEATEVDVGGTALRVDADGLATALSSGFLLVGSEAVVRRSIELADPDDSLAGEDAASRLLGELPRDRLAEAYLSGELATRLSGEPGVGPLGALVGSGSGAVAVGLALEEDAIGVHLRSLGDPETSPGDSLVAALPAFEPGLDELVRSDALVYLGVGEPATSAAPLLDTLSSISPPLARALRSFGRRLERRSGVAVADALLPLLGGEAALTVEPKLLDPPDAASPDGPAPATGAPYLALLADGIDTDAAREQLAALQEPVAAAIGAQGRGGAGFEAREIGGAEAFGLPVSPSVELTYALYDDLLVVATDPLAVERLRADATGLAEAEAFEAATESFADEVSLLLFVRVPPILDLGEQAAGLIDLPAYLRLREDLRAIEAAAAAIRRDDDLLAADVRLVVGERDRTEPGAPAIEVEPE